MKMPIALCFKCGLPMADSFHDYDKICTCISIKKQKLRDKKMGWTTKYPQDREKENIETVKKDAIKELKAYMYWVREHHPKVHEEYLKQGKKG